MLLYPAERQPIARLLQFLEQGERLAHDCAAQQAVLAADSPKAAAFFCAQARQEAMHARLFQGATLWLAPRLGPCPLLPGLELYRVRLEAALSRGDLVESLLAEQVILEGLGEAILGRIEFGLKKRGAGFGFLRRMLLHQEQAHHQFGHRALERAVSVGETSYATLRGTADEYLALADQMVETLADLFGSIDEDPALYLSDARARLPAWLTGTEA